MTWRTANLLLPDERLDVHPIDAARLGVSEGSPVMVTSRRGQVKVPARVTEIVSPGEVFLAFHFPGRTGEPAHIGLDRRGDGLPRVQGDRGPNPVCLRR
jgi:anaerobic selenocysteine-containing dehydrogenase